MLRKYLARSTFFAVFLTIEGMALQVLKERLILHGAPPAASHLVGVTACYLAAAFTFALGFFLVMGRLPGRTSLGKGLRYAVMVLTIWVGGIIGMCAIDFEGGWYLLSAAKMENYWIALCDSINLLIGGLVLGLIVRKDHHAVSVVAPLSGNLAGRMVAGAVLLPVLSAVLFLPAALALPTGLDLSGGNAGVFAFFLFAPLAISGVGIALFHDALRAASKRAALRGSLRVSLFVYLMYWVTSSLFVLFFGFPWQVLVDFLVSSAISLSLTITILEVMARIRLRVMPSGSPSRATFIAFILTALVTAISLQSCAAPKIVVTTPDFSSLADGIYRGSYDSGLVKATVDVSMAHGRIQEVAIVSHRCGRGKPAERIVNDVVSTSASSSSLLIHPRWPVLPGSPCSFPTGGRDCFASLTWSPGAGSLRSPW